MSTDLPVAEAVRIDDAEAGRPSATAPRPGVAVVTGTDERGNVIRAQPVTQHAGGPKPGDTIIVRDDRYGDDVLAQQTGQMPPMGWCALSWFSFLCCFFPVGFASVILTIFAKHQWSRGDYAAANKTAKWARYVAFASIALGLITIVTALGRTRGNCRGGHC